MRNSGSGLFSFSYLPRHGARLERFSGVIPACLALQSISRARSLCLGEAAAVTELPCLQPPAPCPMASHPWEAAAAPALSPWQRGGGVGQSLSHAAFRFVAKHGHGSVVFSVLWGVVTRLHSHFKGSFSKEGSLFPCCEVPIPE